MLLLVQDPTANDAALAAALAAWDSGPSRRRGRGEEGGSPGPVGGGASVRKRHRGVTDVEGGDDEGGDHGDEKPSAKRRVVGSGSNSDTEGADGEAAKGEGQGEGDGEGQGEEGKMDGEEEGGQNEESEEEEACGGENGQDKGKDGAKKDEKAGGDAKAGAVERSGSGDEQQDGGEQKEEGEGSQKSGKDDRGDREEDDGEQEEEGGGDDEGADDGAGGKHNSESGSRNTSKAGSPTPGSQEAKPKKPRPDKISKEGVGKGHHKKGEVRTLVDDLPPDFLKTASEVEKKASEAKEKEKDEDDEEPGRRTLRSDIRPRSSTGGGGQSSATNTPGGGAATPQAPGTGKGKGGGKKGGVRRSEGEPPGEEVKTSHLPWLFVGGSVEVQWGPDWWEATCRRIKVKWGSGSIAMRAPFGHVCVAYVGGTESDNEWIPIDSGRLRKPQENSSMSAPNPQANRKKAGTRPSTGSGDDDGQAWVKVGDEVIECLKDGPMVESLLFVKLGNNVRKGVKAMAINRLILGEFVIKQGSGSVADPIR